MIDSRARDGYAVLAVLEGRELDEAVAQAAALLATVLGQDLETGDGRGVADRAAGRQGPGDLHGGPGGPARAQDRRRGFDGYKGHVAVDPDSEIITATAVTPGNAGDASAAEDLIADLLADQHDDQQGPAGAQPAGPDAEPESSGPSGHADGEDSNGERATVYGDAAYGTGEFHERLARCRDRVAVQDPGADRGGWAVHQGPVRHRPRTAEHGDLPGRGHHPDPPRPAHGGGMAYFGPAAPSCPLRAQCTTAAGGRTITIGPHEQTLADARPARPTRPGSPTTAPPAPRSNANSRT